MKKHKMLMTQFLKVLAVQLILAAAMVTVFAVFGYYDTGILLGAVAGTLIAAGNFFLMALFASRAAAQAQAQDVAGGQRLIQLSYMGRMFGMFLILFLCGKSGLFNLLALVLPLVFVRPALTVAEFFRKKGTA